MLNKFKDFKDAVKTARQYKKESIDCEVTYHYGRVIGMLEAIAAAGLGYATGKGVGKIIAIISKK